MSITLPGVPEGYEQVRWGFPKKGDSYLGSDGSVLTADFDFDTIQHLIVRKIWTPPEWLKPGWIYINFGKWCWSDRMPYACPDTGKGFSSSLGSLLLNLSHTNFIGPDVSPENSLIEIVGPE